jgi:hypothetical protein
MKGTHILYTVLPPGRTLVFVWHPVYHERARNVRGDYAMRVGLVCVLLLTLVGVGVSSTGCTGGNPGYVKVTNPGVEVQFGTGWMRTVTVSSQSGPVTIPAGTYTPKAICLTEKESASAKSSEKRATWTLTSKGPFENLESIVVEQGKTTTLDAGPPLTVTAYPYQTGDVVRMTVEVSGKAGEVYPLTASRDGVPQRLPVIKILDESGKVLQSGNLEYG